MFMRPQLKRKTPPNKPPIDAIVHLGAGRCSELDGYLAQQPRRLLLVEADPQLAEDLKNRTKDRESVKVTCAAIAGLSGPATFNRYNLLEANSLHSASGLLELFPGLKTVEQLKVDAIRPDSLLNQLNLNAAQENLLVMDLPGEELPVFKALQQSQKLHLFSQVILHCGCQALYEGSEPAARILEWLRDEGYDLVAEDPGVDPDHLCWTLRRNVMQLRNLELTEQLERSIKKNQEVVNQVAALQDRVETLTKKLDVQKKNAEETETQIEQLKKACDEQIKLAADRGHQITELRRVRDKRVNLDVELQTQIAVLIQSRDEQAKLAVKRQSKIENLNRAKTNFEKHAIERKQQIDELSITQNEQEKFATKQQSKIDKLNKTNEEVKKFAEEQGQKIGQLTNKRIEQTKLINQLKVKIDQVAKDIEKQETIVTEYQVLFDQANYAKAQSEKLVDRCIIQIDELTRICDEQTQLSKDRQEHINQLVHEQKKISKLASDRQSEISQLKDKLHQARKTADLATKLQMLRESDLKELQQQHKKVIAKQKKQNHLFKKLEGRLMLAANYFHQLEDLQSVIKNQQAAMSSEIIRSGPNMFVKSSEK
jgi:FkbM family methyltransferase